MVHAGFLLKVKANRIKKHKEIHKRVWSGMLKALRRNGWYNDSIFMREDSFTAGI